MFEIQGAHGLIDKSLKAQQKKLPRFKQPAIMYISRAPLTGCILSKPIYVLKIKPVGQWSETYGSP